jgi:hypothetical protein
MRIGEKHWAVTISVQSGMFWKVQTHISAEVSCVEKMIL